MSTVSRQVLLKDKKIENKLIFWMLWFLKEENIFKTKSRALRISVGIEMPTENFSFLLLKKKQ